MKLPLLSTGHLRKLFSPPSPFTLGHGDNTAHHVRPTGASNEFRHAKDICGTWDPGKTQQILGFAGICCGEPGVTLLEPKPGLIQSLDKPSTGAQNVQVACH